MIFMQHNPKEGSARGITMLFLAVISALALKEGLVNDGEWYKICFITIPILIILLITGYTRKV